MRRLWARWRSRNQVVAECECGRPLRRRDRHLLVAHFDDTDELAAMSLGGGTMMAADFCREHCPGGCDRRCLPSVG